MNLYKKKGGKKMKRTKTLTISVDSFKLLLECLNDSRSSCQSTINVYADENFDDLPEHIKKRILEAKAKLPHLDELELELYGFGG